MPNHRHDRGLSADLVVLNRRRVLQFMLGASLLRCGMGDGTETSPDGSCSKIPEETAGPYPGDGSNGVNALTLSGIVRSDLRPSLASSLIADGVPLTVTLQLVGLASNCEPLTGLAVYAWHCDREGRYSLYDREIVSESYLRGVQASGSDGKVTFTTIFPACYDGRWPHIHFEVYPGLSTATSSTTKLATSQLALPEAACEAVYAVDGYEQSVSNFSRVSLSSDMVFSDGVSTQLPSISGNVTDGFTAALTVGLNVASS